MSDRPPVFGSYGQRSVFDGTDSSERPLFASGRSKAVSRPVFGKRQKPPSPETSLGKERLLNLHSELTMLFKDLAFPEDTLPFAFHDGERPHVHVSAAGCVRIDESSGSYVFSDETAGASSILITTSHDRLLDAILSHLVGAAEAPAPELASVMVDRCVGHTVGDVERSLILATLRHCAGNRTHAARMLGISLRTLRNKLRAYWQPARGKSDARENTGITIRPLQSQRSFERGRADAD